MAECECGMVFFPAFFDGVCPKCGKKFDVSEEEIEQRDIMIEVCKKMNEELEKLHK